MSLILDGIRTEKELCKIITAIVDFVTEEDHRINKEQLLTAMHQGFDLDRLAMTAQLKIEAKQIKRIKKAILIILKRSTNKMIVATIAMSGN